MNATTAAVLADAGPPPPTGGDEPPASPAPLGVFFLGYVVIGPFVGLVV
jgi:hypothetical protein